MKTESEDHVDKFLQLVRSIPLDHSTQEYAFETRFMARLQEEELSWPPTLAWKLIPYFTSGIIALSALLYFNISTTQSRITANLLANSSSEYNEDLLSH